VDLTKVLSKKRGDIFVLLMKKPYLTITEISEEMNLPHPPVTRYVHELKKNKLLNMKLDDKGIKKLCYPSLRGFFENMAQKVGLTFENRLYQDLDDILLDKRIKPIIFKLEDVDALTMITSGIFRISNMESIKKLFELYNKKENKDLLEKVERSLLPYIEAISKKFI